jgi:hypothetical protein
MGRGRKPLAVEIGEQDRPRMWSNTGGATAAMGTLLITAKFAILSCK